MVVTTVVVEMDPDKTEPQEHAPTRYRQPSEASLSMMSSDKDAPSNRSC